MVASPVAYPHIIKQVSAHLYAITFCLLPPELGGYSYNASVCSACTFCYAFFPTYLLLDSYYAPETGR